MIAVVIISALYPFYEKYQNSPKIHNNHIEVSNYSYIYNGYKVNTLNLNLRHPYWYYTVVRSFGVTSVIVDKFRLNYNDTSMEIPSIIIASFNIKDINKDSILNYKDSLNYYELEQVLAQQNTPSENVKWDVNIKTDNINNFSFTQHSSELAFYSGLVEAYALNCFATSASETASISNYSGNNCLTSKPNIVLRKNDQLDIDLKYQVTSNIKPNDIFGTVATIKNNCSGDNSKSLMAKSYQRTDTNLDNTKNEAVLTFINNSLSQKICVQFLKNDIYADTSSTLYIISFESEVKMSIPKQLIQLF